MNISKKLFSTLLFSALCIGGAAHAQEAEIDGAATLKVTFTGLRSDAGTVLYSLYNGAEGFPSDGSKAVRVGKVSAHKGSVEVSLAGLPAGTYAVSFFHDENNNGKLDTNSFGMPTEGFGFSDNPQVMFSAPSFDDAKFSVPAAGTSIDISTKYF